MATVELDHQGSGVKLETTYTDRHLIQQLPGARYDGNRKIWTAPLSWATCVTLRGLFGDNLHVGEELADWAWAERRVRIEPASTGRDVLSPLAPVEELEAIEANTHLKLYPYQQADVAFLAVNKRALLANPPGLGKTGVAIRTIQVLKARGAPVFPAVIICPNSLKFTVWKQGIEEWAPELTVTVVDGSAGKRRKQLQEDTDLYIINWDSLRLHSRLAPYGSISLTEKERTPKELNELKPVTVIMDEAHRLKDARAQQTRAAWAVAHQAVNRFALTGTPVANNIGDLWGLLHCLEPTWFPGKTRFLDRYAQTSLNYYGGAEIVGINPHNRDELFSLLDPLMRRVPKEAALPQLPPKLPVQYRHTPMSPSQQKAYEQMQSDMLVMLNELLVAPNPLSQLTRLFQFAAASAEIVDGHVRLSAPSAKVDDLVDLLEELGEEPLVVAAVSRQLIELASARLTKLKISHGLVTGAQSSMERRDAVDAFQAGKTRVILLTTGAGAEGITLTRANTMLFMQRDYSEVKNQQAEDRVHRIGSERHDVVRIIDQITPGTVEERKLELLTDKQRSMEEIVRDATTLRKLLGG